MKHFLASMITLAVTFLYGGNAFSLSIPITVRDALPANVASGWDRTDEPVRLGVPLMEGVGISSIDQLSVRGAADFQFRVMGGGLPAIESGFWWIFPPRRPPTAPKSLRSPMGRGRPRGR